MMRWIALLSLLCCACLKPASPPDQWRAICTVQPIICEGSGWTDGEVGLQTMWCNSFYSESGIAFHFNTPVTVHDDRFLDFGEADLLDLNGHGESAARSDGVCAVWFVRSIDYRGQSLAGLAHYPFGFPGNQYGVVVSHSAVSPRGEKTLSHELGHTFGLRHPWEDDIPDTLQTLIEQGCAVQPCNLMSYCFAPHLNLGTCSAVDSITPGQIAEMRRWATHYTRTAFTVGVGANKMQATARVQQVSEPAIDPTEWR